MTLPRYGLSKSDVEYLTVLVTRYDAGWWQASDIITRFDQRQCRRSAKRLAEYGLVDTRRRNTDRLNALIVRATASGVAFVAGMLTTQHKNAAQ